MPVVVHGRKTDDSKGPSRIRIFAVMKKSSGSRTPLPAARSGRLLVRVGAGDDRSRFGIESSYRQMSQARGRTSARRLESRLLCVGMALLLRNEWVWLYVAVLSTPRCGGSMIRQERLRLRELLHWLVQVIEEAYITIHETQTERQLCSELLDCAPSFWTSKQNRGFWEPLKLKIPGGHEVERSSRPPKALHSTHPKIDLLGLPVMANHGNEEFGVIQE